LSWPIESRSCGKFEEMLRFRTFHLMPIIVEFEDSVGKTVLKVPRLKFREEGLKK